MYTFLYVLSFVVPCMVFTVPMVIVPMVIVSMVIPVPFTV